MNSDNSFTAAEIDLAIIGSGPAALTAALYAARAGLQVKVFERAKIGGALTEIVEISNYPGFFGSGKQLAEQMRRQAESFGVEVIYGDCTDIRRVATSSSQSAKHSPNVSVPGARHADERQDSSYAANAGGSFELVVDAEPVRTRTVLVATGSAPRRLDFAVDRPVSYCALCDGELAKGKHVAVVGGANSAAQESIYLSSLATDVTLITHSQLKADHFLQKRLRELPNIKIIEHTEPTPELLTQFDHIFVYIGHYPATNFLLNLATTATDSALPLLDAQGYVLTAPHSHHTVVPGLFVAGDVRAGAIRQAVTAAGDGASAAVEIIEFLGLDKSYE